MAIDFPVDKQPSPPATPGTNFPPEYQGSKLESTRTARDLFITYDEMSAYIKRGIEEALKKDKKQEMEKAQHKLRNFFLLLIASPMITYLEYLIYMKIMGK